MTESREPSTATGGRAGTPPALALDASVFEALSTRPASAPDDRSRIVRWLDCWAGRSAE